MTEEERFLGSATPQTGTPLVHECKLYLVHMKDCNDSDPLYFWTKCQQQFPILALVARRVLAVPATSASTERLFSAGGRVCTFDRTRMKPKNVGTHTTLHVWERSALGEDRRTLQRLAANEKFCCLKVDDLFSVTLVPGGLDDYDDDEELVDDE